MNLAMPFLLCIDLDIYVPCRYSAACIYSLKHGIKLKSAVFYNIYVVTSLLLKERVNFREIKPFLLFFSKVN
jgi:hypothetical protein